MILLASLLLLAGGNLAYIDALFFASGACTQAGLNTIDVDTLTTWQQVVGDTVETNSGCAFPFSLGYKFNSSTQLRCRVSIMVVSF
jgi:hypothetical protein